MSDEIREWLASWLASRSGISAAEILRRSEIDYLEAGLVDSFGVIELIGEIEGRYPIVFTDDDFNDPRFSTIDGLAEMVGTACG